MNRFTGHDQRCFIYDGKFYETLITFDCCYNSKSIIIYTDNTYDDAGRINVYASYYTKNGQEIIINDIDNDKDYNTVVSVLDKVQETIRQGYDTDDVTDIVSEYFNSKEEL